MGSFIALLVDNNLSLNWSVQRIEYVEYIAYNSPLHLSKPVFNQCLNLAASIHITHVTLKSEYYLAVKIAMFLCPPCHIILFFPL